jgi:competence ComEA-like helix-hairpin-helix protein
MMLNLAEPGVGQGVELAGELRPGQSLGRLPLSRWLLLLLCSILLAAGAANGKKAPPAAALDLNAATATQLVQVPGIGAATARAIVQFRQKSGPFQRVEDLLAIRGISARKLAQIRPYVTVVKRPPLRPSSSRGNAISSV